MPPISQRQYQEYLIAANRAVIARIRDAITDVSSVEITRRSRSGGWSIADVLEHLVLSADAYLGVLRRIVEGGNGANVSTHGTWKASLMGGLLVRSFRSPRKRRAPGIIRPGPVPRAQVVDEFVKRHEALERLIADSAGIDWRHVRMRSPVLPIIRMNLGDAFTVLVTHAERHAAQIERLKTTLERPS